MAAIAALTIWIAVRQGRQAGAADQAAKDSEFAREAEAAIHEIQAETRDTSDTMARLRKGKF